MQIGSGARQTCGRSMAVAGLKTGLAMDLNSEVITNNKTGSKLKSQISFIDAVMYRLEEEETLLEQLIGYGICSLTVLYLLGSLARVLF